MPKHALACLALLLPLLAAGNVASAGESRTHDAAHDDTLHTEKLRLGPFTLGAGADLRRTGLVPRPTGDFVLKHFSADLVFADGTPVPRSDVHLHHIAIARLNAEDPACPGRVAGGYFPDLKVWVILASGAERTPIDLYDPFGYFEPAGSWGANYHLVNASDASQTFYVEYTVKYLKGLDHPELVPTTPYFMDVAGNCTTAEYNVPGSGIEGTTHTKSWEFPIAEQGTILGSGGHLHYHGIATELYDDDKKLLCRSEAVYGDGGHAHSAPLESRSSHEHEHGEAVQGMTTCPWIMETVEAGDVLELRSIYHNTNEVRGAMGINITMIAHNFVPPPEWFPQVPDSTTTTAPATTAPTTTAPVGDTTTTAGQTTTTTSQTAAPISATPRYTG